MKSASRSARNRAQSSVAISPARFQQLDKRLLAYALAGAGAVTLAPAANAEIVFTPTDITLSQGLLQIDLNGDGITDFTLHDHLTSYYVFGGRLKIGGTPPGAEVLGFYYQGGFPEALAAPLGWPIGPQSPSFIPAHLQLVQMAITDCSTRKGHCFFQAGPWANASNKFLGLRFQINGEFHYGWARLSVSTQYRPIRAKLTGYAYETIPDTKILAGDKGAGAANSDAEGASFENGTHRALSLGMLSLGSTRIKPQQITPATSNEDAGK
jgi:hypothetical protein